jgi:glycine cleavage system H protein
MSVPGDLQYTKSHEWVRVEDGVATVGITDHAQDELGDVVFVELPETGATLAPGDSFGAVESVKAVSDLYAPIGGEVVEVNTALEDSPEKINEDPYGEGWILKLQISDDGDLLSAADYEKLLEEES